jgi:hypothetical protein
MNFFPPRTTTRHWLGRQQQASRMVVGTRRAMTVSRRLRLPAAALRLAMLLSAAATIGAPPPPPPPPLYAVSAATITVDPSVSIASLSGAMNGAGMEELNHEIYGGVYSQMYALDTLSVASLRRN